MKHTTFEVDRENGRVFLGDRLFRLPQDAPRTVLENPMTKERVILQRYEESKEAILSKKEAILRHLTMGRLLPSPDGAQGSLIPIEDAEIFLIDEINGVRTLRNVIYPYGYTFTEAEEEEQSFFYTVTEYPAEDFEEKYAKLEEAVIADQLPLYQRILAALSLCETIDGIRDYFGELIESVHPEEIYVNLESGEICLFLEKWLRPAKKAAGEQALSDMLAYYVFRLLCVEDPYDGSQALIDLPCLTKEALRRLHDGRYHFIFAGKDNEATGYVGQQAAARWKLLPAFLKRQFLAAFAKGPEDPTVRIRTADWLKTVRQLRDCLVYVNNQFRLCDPEVSNKVLFLTVNDYSIPVWSKKAVYWYHGEYPYEKTKNGIIGGFTAEGFLENCTMDSWVVEVDQKTFLLPPEHSVKPLAGMKITLSEEAQVQVVSGEKDTGTEPVSVNQQPPGSILPENPLADWAKVEEEA